MMLQHLYHRSVLNKKRSSSSISFLLLQIFVILLLVVCNNYKYVTLLLPDVVVVVTADVILPKMELRQVHLEYETTHKSSSSSSSTSDRTLQDTNTSTTTDESIYQPIRIVFDTRVLDTLYGQGNTEIDSKIDFIKSTILPQTAEKWAQHLYVIPVSSTTPIVIDSTACFGFYESFLTTSISYTNADIVVIVGGDPEMQCETGPGTLAYAFPCDIDQQINRPFAGSFNFCLSRLGTSTSISVDNSNLQALSPNLDLSEFYSIYTNTTFYPERLTISLLEVTVHELGHILGFNSLLYTYTRDEFGVPRTPRDTTTNQPVLIQRLCGNGTATLDFVPPDTVIQVQTSSYDPTRYESFFVTERVRAVSQIQFNCSALVGGRLEDLDSNSNGGCFGSHWHERHYYGELLSPIVNEGSENVLSYTTLALMEDTGWYKVDYRGARYPSFGLLAGCGFVNEPCINRTSGQISDSAENEFCTTPLYLDTSGIPAVESLNGVFCDPSYQSWVLCDLSNIRPQETVETTYFSDPQLTTIFFRRAENCPIPSVNLGVNCLDDAISSTYNEFYAGESVGPNSRCVNAYYESSFGRAYQPACIRITCDVDAGVVRIGNDDTEYICDYDGQLLTVGGGRSDGATIICPRLATVCPQLFTCPDACFGRGECVYTNVDANGRIIPTCRCFDTTNSHPSCAPSFFANLASNVTTPTASPRAIPPVVPSSTAVPMPPFFNGIDNNTAPTETTLPPTPPPTTMKTSTSAPAIRRTTTRPTTANDTASPTTSNAGYSCYYYHHIGVTSLIITTTIIIWL